MDLCTSLDTLHNSPTSLSLQDLLNAPAQAESLLELLTPAQILAIEQTLGKVKRRRLDKDNSKSVTPSPPPAPPALKTPQTNTTPSEPVTEIKDGIEWVSFVYSHNRTLKRYSIRTDLQNIDISVMDDKFKSENCVYPRANLPKEEYTGNRWAYETECNMLGWKLAWLNNEEIAGKRGLIQRAVDSYRNRYPSMRSRRVARQEKLMNGTLRKRKHREGEDSLSDPSTPSEVSSLASVTTPSAHHPKTIAIEDTATNQRFRIKINVESVELDEINIEFRMANCPYPRVMNTKQPIVNSTRWLEESMCNELAWKLAWLNPRHLAGKKNMLQRALDIYRSKFMPSLQPRKNSHRTAPIPPPTLTPQDPLLSLLTPGMPLTADALSAQNALFEQQKKSEVPAEVAAATIAVTSSPAMSNMSGTTESLDFGDCFSLADEDTKEDSMISSGVIDTSMFVNEAMHSDEEDNSIAGRTSSYASDSTACTPSPVLMADQLNLDTSDFFGQFMMPPLSMDDPFNMLNISPSSNTASELSKLYNTPIDDTFASSLLDPLF
ncbi:hypothetical protein K501DRAFT_338678 [Backusella circina FSU 941]|nr:hypothetical protein K501DRAFT_338678 [Backusella circina FSU 941]